MKLRKLTKNKKGASMLDYFILSLVSLLIGSSVLMLGGQIKKGINLSKTKVENINSILERN